VIVLQSVSVSEGRVTPSSLIRRWRVYRERRSD